MEHQIGIHLNLPEDITQKIFALQKKLKLGYEGQHETIPHITMHLAKFPKKNFKKLLNFLNNLNIKPFEIKIFKVSNEFNKMHKNYFLDLEIVNDKILYNFHKKIVLMVDKMRNKQIRQKDLQRIKNGKFSRQEILMIKKHGYVRVMKYFVPHITLGEINPDSQVKDKINIIKKELAKLKNKTFTVDSFTIGSFVWDNKKNQFIDKLAQYHTIKLKQ
ncbi:MAG TPA: DUF1045 domain-containing protein [bacterium]|nr:DUF1045 domain-containing protein [bacterium]